MLVNQLSRCYYRAVLKNYRFSVSFMPILKKALRTFTITRQKLRLKMFLRFTSKQTYRIFLFLYILFAIHHSLRCWYLLFEAKSGSCKSWIYRFLQNENHAKVQSKTNKYCKFHVDLTRRRLSKSRFKKLGMVPKKLYRNTLKLTIVGALMTEN